MDMDHGSDSGSSSAACKISMLWNWYTIDACFISKQWHIRSKGMFAGSCIGVILLVMSVELLRRLGKEYDASLYRQFYRRATASPHGSDGATLTFRATPPQQLVRAFIHACAFGAAYIVMLLAMYYNGYIIICIFIGAGLGKFVCDWLVVKINPDTLLEESGKKPGGIEETTVCCA